MRRVVFSLRCEERGIQANSRWKKKKGRGEQTSGRRTRKEIINRGIGSLKKKNIRNEESVITSSKVRDKHDDPRNLQSRGLRTREPEGFKSRGRKLRGPDTTTEPSKR